MVAYGNLQMIPLFPLYFYCSLGRAKVHWVKVTQEISLPWYRDKAYNESETSNKLVTLVPHIIYHAATRLRQPPFLPNCPWQSGFQGWWKKCQPIRWKSEMGNFSSALDRLGSNPSLFWIFPILVLVLSIFRWFGYSNQTIQSYALKLFLSEYQHVFWNFWHYDFSSS